MATLVGTSDIKDSRFDGVVVVVDSPSNITDPDLAVIKTAVSSYAQLAGDSEPAVIPCADVPGGRIIYGPTGPVTRDYDDVRRFYDAAKAALKRAMSAGCSKPLLIGSAHSRYELAARVTYLGALQEIYKPLELREARPGTCTMKLDTLGLYKASEQEVKIIQALEAGRVVARDLGGSDPERMAPPAFAKYVQSVFEGTNIKVTVIDDVEVIEKEYPLMAAVNRASKFVPRHHCRLIFLEYVGEGPIDQTLLFVGKGITFDTGGCDLKVNGAMVGMHRDKCGAAAVAGFFKTLSQLKPKGLKVVGGLAVTRNSIGSNCYTCDEIITSRAGVRIRIGNTDAEGRMAMGDVLCHMKEKAPKEVNPHLFTVATLTGHVIRAYGPDYASVNSNGPAISAGTPEKLYSAGAKTADPFEISTLRREDYVFHAGKSGYEDVLQSNSQPSTMTNRGHQAPMAFLIMASGLDKHGNDSNSPLAYSHLDIAGASGLYPGMVTGAPVVALSHAYILNRELTG